MLTRELQVTTGSTTVSDITDDVAGFAATCGDGLLNVFVPHATAGVALMETGSGSEHDLGIALERLLPPGGDYAHRHGSAGHGRDHLLPVFVSPSLTVPVAAGHLQLGTWQRVVLVDTNVDNQRRTIRLSFVSG